MTLKDKISDLYEKHREKIFANDPPELKLMRENSFQSFLKQDFPNSRLEAWKNTDLKKILEIDYNIQFEPENKSIDMDKVFQCEVPDFDTHIISLYNGWYIYRDKPLQTLPNGTILGSFSQALKEYPELVLKHYNQYAKNQENGFNALNTAYAQDGVFIYVPDGVETYKTIQMVNVLDKEENLFVQNRNLVILGKNSKLTLVHCDDSHNHQASLSNTVSEIFLDEGAQINHYKLQNLNNDTSLINATFFHQEKDSKISTFAISLNGGMIRNDIRVKLNGRGSHADVQGLYLMDKNQHVDNQVFIDHAQPDCTSNELFKGILDDQASAVFNGHILVRKDAQRTNAFQTNRNILLTDKATVNTKPFLEIYADDVKCSHGATVGQMDENALFYIKSRGISTFNAKLLLMYAFAAEVINTIDLRPLKERIDDLVKKRLRGELAVCDQCVLHCKNQEKGFEFEIDMSKL
ncbi:MAG: Fe-S cluster assembly protein SufD [Bacteroidales bacterium]|nr:Fe-S cluster assembly protein SufD [Bacteroidales bacterium]MCF8404287.1 Fe-S cluster assembly protein SufD [Bacteroidales bacterium]